MLLVVSFVISWALCFSISFARRCNCDYSSW